MRTTVALLITLALAVLSPCLDARERPSKLHPRVVAETTRLHQSDLRSTGRSLFGLAAAGTTWLGADPTGTSVVVGGVWDFDNRGTIVCSSDPNDTTVYIKNGAFAQGWISEDVYAQKGTYFHAEDFSDPGFACSRGPISGGYSAWCGKVSREPTECFTDAPGYGHSWNQWLSRIVTLAPENNSLSYTFRCNTEAGSDYVYAWIDTLVTTQECGYVCGYWPNEVDPQPDTLRHYHGNLTTLPDSTEFIDISNPTDWHNWAPVPPGFYDGKTVRISFVVWSDCCWDDADGLYPTCDGAFAVDDIIITTMAGPDTTDFETGTLEEWTACRGQSPGGDDFAAIRDISSFVNNDECGFDACGMAGCVLTFFDPSIPGEYGMGGHKLDIFHNRAWSPVIDLTVLPDAWGFVAHLDAYLDLPVNEWFFYRYFVRYATGSGCPTGTWSTPISDGYAQFSLYTRCLERYWDFSGFVPQDADSLQFGLSASQGCWPWAVPCYHGNETPIFDNVRVGIYGDIGAPPTNLIDFDNFCDAFPEDGTCDSTSTARIDVANNLARGRYNGSRHFLNLGDSLVVRAAGDEVRVDFCFKVIPGPGTDLENPFFTSWFPGTYVSCDTSAGVNPFHCARMDTAFLAGNGVNPVTQLLDPGSYASLFHEEDSRSGGVEGIEILPDSLFTAGTKIYYYIKSSFIGSGYFTTTPNGACEEDLSTLFEIEVLPDLCKNPPACLIYFDYFDRGAQASIEQALTDLGRTWDRYDVRAETSKEGNGIGNRYLGPGKYTLRGPIGPSIAQLDQYGVVFINCGNSARDFSDGGESITNDPTDDLGAMEAYLTEGPSRGLWLNGTSVAENFGKYGGGPQLAFLSDVLGVVFDDKSYRTFSGHDLSEPCRELNPHWGDAASDNYFSVADSIGLYGSGCPTRYDFDVIHKNPAAGGIVGNALLYDRSDLPGQSQGGPAYASVYHVFPTGSGTDSARTVLDGFSLHRLRDERCWTGKGIRDWARDLLGNPGPSGVIAPGFFALRPSGESLCPPVGDELVGTDGPPPARYSYRLSQNYPNPFRAQTTIRFSTKKKERVEILVFDAAGRLVKRLNKVTGPGEGSIVWDGTEGNGRPVASGVYFYQIRAGDFVSGKRMILVK